jgi:hypothetical protein
VALANNGKVTGRGVDRASTHEQARGVQRLYDLRTAVRVFVNGFLGGNPHVARTI